MKIGFTGTRKGMTEQQKNNFKKVLKASKAKVFTHGDCIGADLDGHLIATDLQVEIRKRPCNLKSQRAFSNGGEIVAEPEQPLDRNKKIVDDSDILVACPGETTEELRSGTWATIRYGRKAQKAIVILWPNGKVEFENWQNRPNKILT